MDIDVDYVVKSDAIILIVTALMRGPRRRYSRGPLWKTAL